MKLSDLKIWIETLLLITTIVTAALSKWVTDQLVKTISFVALICVALGFIIYKSITFFHKRKIAKQSMSNNSVIKNSEKHCKTLYRYAKANEKQLLKNKKVSKISSTRRKEDKILEKLKGKDNDKKQQEKAKNKLNKLAKSFKDTDAIDLIKSLEEQQDYQVSQLLSDTFMNLERILLNAEQFELRIKFGHYINSFSSNTENRIKANIDFLGWTYMMMGEITKGEKAIFAGIKKAEIAISETKNEQTKQRLYLLITRGYRHLGSARTTSEKQPEKALKYLEQAQTHLNLIKANKPEMEAGINYGVLAANYFYFVNKAKDINITDKDYLKFYHSYLLIDDQLEIVKDFKNKHRYVKYQLLKTKYTEELIKHFNAFANHVEDFDKKHIIFIEKEDNKSDLIVLLDNVKGSLGEVEEIFGNNIFMDEAVEYYLEENINCLKHRLIKLLEGSIK